MQNIALLEDLFDLVGFVQPISALTFSFLFHRMCKTAMALLLGLVLVLSTGLVKYIFFPDFFYFSLVGFNSPTFVFSSAQTNATDQAALVAFWKGLTNTETLGWNTTASLCDQNGVYCTGQKVAQL